METGLDEQQWQEHLEFMKALHQNTCEFQIAQSKVRGPSPLVKALPILRVWNIGKRIDVTA